MAKAKKASKRATPRSAVTGRFEPCPGNRPELARLAHRGRMLALEVRVGPNGWGVTHCPLCRRTVFHPPDGGVPERSLTPAQAEARGWEVL